MISGIHRTGTGVARLGNRVHGGGARGLLGKRQAGRQIDRQDDDNDQKQTACGEEESPRKQIEDRGGGGGRDAQERYAAARPGLV